MENDWLFFSFLVNLICSFQLDLLALQQSLIFVQKSTDFYTVTVFIPVQCIFAYVNSGIVIYIYINTVSMLITFMSKSIRNPPGIVCGAIEVTQFVNRITNNEWIQSNGKMESSTLMK